METTSIIQIDKSIKHSFSSLAREIGVTTPVVSSILRNTSATTFASSATKQRILEAAWSKGFRLNSNIGIVVPAEIKANEVLYYPGFAGMMERCAELGMGVFNASFSGDTPAIPDFILKREISGVIFWGRAPQNMKSLLITEKIPFIILNPFNEQLENDAVYFSDYETMTSLLEYLLTKGYKEYIYVSHGAAMTYIKEVTESFNDFIKAESLKGTVLLSPPEGSEKLIAQVSSMIEHGNSKTVFITPARMFTIKILELFAAHGKTIPADAGVVGSNALADFCIPKMTTVVYPFYEMGVAAVDMMQEKWNKRQFHLSAKKIQGIIIKNESTKGA